MASGHVNRIQRPNTWLHRPMLQNMKKLLPTRSRPHMTQSEHGRVFKDPGYPNWSTGTRTTRSRASLCFRQCGRSISARPVAAKRCQTDAALVDTPPTDVTLGVLGRHGFEGARHIRCTRSRDVETTRERARTALRPARGQAIWRLTLCFFSLRSRSRIASST